MDEHFNLRRNKQNHDGTINEPSDIQLGSKKGAGKNILNASDPLYSPSSQNEPNVGIMDLDHYFERLNRLGKTSKSDSNDSLKSSAHNDHLKITQQEMIEKVRGNFISEWSNISRDQSF